MKTHTPLTQLLSSAHGPGSRLLALKTPSVASPDTRFAAPPGPTACEGIIAMPGALASPSGTPLIFRSVGRVDAV